MNIEQIVEKWLKSLIFCLYCERSEWGCFSKENHLFFQFSPKKRLGNKCHKVKAKMPLWKVVSGRKTDDSKRSRRAQSLLRMDSASSLFLLFKLFLGKVFRTMTITKGLWGRRWIKKFEIGSPLMRNFFFFFPASSSLFHLRNFSFWVRGDCCRSFSFASQQALILSS